MRIERITSITEAEKIIPEWRDIVSVSMNSDIFHFPEWYMAYWKLLPSSAAAELILFYEETLVGILPVVWAQKEPFRSIHLMGQPHFIARSDFILSAGFEKKCLKAFVTWLSRNKKWHMVYFRNFGEFTDNPEILKKYSEQAGMRCGTITGSLNYYVPLEKYSDINDYQQEIFTSKRRKSFRNQRNRLNKFKSVEWQMDTRIDSEQFNEMIKLDLLKKEYGLDYQCYFLLPEKREFLYDVLESIRDKVEIQKITLKIENEAVASIICFLHGRKLFAYQTAFDPHFSRISPGLQVCLKMIETAISSGLAEADLMIGEQDYKTNFTTQSRQCKHFYILNRSWTANILHCYYQWGKPITKKLKNTFPTLHEQWQGYKRKRYFRAKKTSS